MNKYKMNIRKIIVCLCATALLCCGCGCGKMREIPLDSRYAALVEQENALLEHLTIGDLAERFQNKKRCYVVEITEIMPPEDVVLEEYELDEYGFADYDGKMLHLWHCEQVVIRCKIVSKSGVAEEFEAESEDEYVFGYVKRFVCDDGCAIDTQWTDFEGFKETETLLIFDAYDYGSGPAMPLASKRATNLNMTLVIDGNGTLYSCYEGGVKLPEGTGHL